MKKKYRMYGLQSSKEKLNCLIANSSRDCALWD